MSSAENGRSISVVTVTYGDRWNLLIRLLEFLEASSQVSNIVVVDNGALKPIAPLVAGAKLRKAKVIRTPRNLGSAGGFKSGLETVSTYGAEWILLLDDDNLPESSALETLIRATNGLSVGQRARCAFLAFRPSHQADIAAGVRPYRCYPGNSSFLGFHVADIPYKIWRRLPWGRPSASRGIAPRIALPYAPYSGLLIHRSLLQRIGMPMPELVLYADDTEFSYRITKSGGQIWLLTEARLLELEASWNQKRRAQSSFEKWLTEGSELRVFYASRNQAYFDSNFWVRSTTLYRLNRFVYLMLLKLFSARCKCRERYALLRRAIGLGERGNLGIEPDFPLP